MIKQRKTSNWRGNESRIKVRGKLKGKRYLSINNVFCNDSDF